MWLLGASFAALRIAQCSGVTGPLACLVGFGVTPVILTGGFYNPGYTHLPGITLTLWVIAAAVPSRWTCGAVKAQWILAGFLLGILAFLKVTMFPVAALALLAVVIQQRAWGLAVRAVAGFLGAVLGVVTLLIVRGEFVPYMTSLMLNVSY